MELFHPTYNWIGSGGPPWLGIPRASTCQRHPFGRDDCIGKTTRIGIGKTLLIMSTWNPKHPFISGCFNWMIPILYIGNGCFTKHPIKNGCLEYQAYP